MMKQRERDDTVEFEKKRQLSNNSQSFGKQKKNKLQTSLDYQVTNYTL